MNKIDDLINRLNAAVLKLNLSNKIHAVYYDPSEDIVTIAVLHGVDMTDVYTSIESSGLLKKDDQIAIVWV